MSDELNVSLEDGNSLRNELGKALTCYERALFFATNLPAQLNFSVREDRTPREREARITSIYSEAGKLLTFRLEKISKRHFDLQIELKNAGIEIADRDKTIADLSKMLVRNNFQSLLAEVIKKLKVPSGLSLKDEIDDLSMEWVGLNNISYLLMDEITHVSGRVDNFLNLLNAYKSEINTLKSIKYGAIGVIASILISSTFSLCGLLKGSSGSAGKSNVNINTVTFPSPAPAAGDRSTNTNENADDHGISNQLAAIDTKITNLTQQLSDISKSLIAQVGDEKTLSKSTDDIAPRIESLKIQLNNLQIMVATNTAHTPDDIRFMRYDIDVLTRSVDALKRDIPSKKALINFGHN